MDRWIMGAAMLIMRIIARSIAPRASPMRSPVSSHSLLSPPLACFHLQLTSSWLAQAGTCGGNTSCGFCAKEQSRRAPHRGTHPDWSNAGLMVRELSVADAGAPDHVDNRGWLSTFTNLVGGWVAPSSREGATMREPDEPYPGFSQGMPYTPQTEEDLFWQPTQAVDNALPAAKGNDCGVGLNLTWHAEAGALIVDEVMPGGAAARSGLIRADDIVCEVDGINVTGQPLDIVDSLVRGPPDSVLRLVLIRMGQDADAQEKEIAVTLIREPGASRDSVRVRRVGVGITFETDSVDNSAKVKRLVRNSPADRSGLIKAGDVLYEVDSTNVFRDSLDVVAQLLLGAPGTTVRLLFLRGTRVFVEATLIREEDRQQSDMAEVLRYAQKSKCLSSKDMLATANDMQHGEDETNAFNKRKSLSMPANFHASF